ncbi:MAG TPA: ABC transporter permease, partial [Candidatus Acidoferrum sp.]
MPDEPAPNWSAYVRENLRLSGFRPERESEIVEEIAQQLDEAYSEALGSGRTEVEARAAAESHIADWTALRHQLASSQREKEARVIVALQQVQERDLQRHGKFSLLTEIRQDLLYAARLLRKSPGFTAIAVLTLALGMGVNTAIFSMVDFLVLRPLPIQDPARVRYLISESKSGNHSTAFSYPNFQDIRQQTTSVFSDIALFQPLQMDGLSVNGKSESMWTAYVTGNAFNVFGIKPALGRLILPSEGQVAGADPVLVLSYAYWKSRFNADPAIIGQKASVNGQPVTIIGVAAEGFNGPTALLDMQGYMPLGMAAVMKDAPKDFLMDREVTLGALIARLKRNVTDQQVRVALSVVAERLSQQYPKADPWMTLQSFQLGPAGLAVDPSNPHALSVVSVPFLVLGGFVLLLVCMNVTNLLLARATTRRREMAVRAALGGTRGRLVRQLLTESVLLAILGCVGGIVLGLVASRAIGTIPFHISLPIVMDFHFDWRVFTYALAAALMTGLLVGITPALRAASRNLGEILRESGRTATSGRQYLRSAIVITQVGGSLMLLIVAGLFVRSLENVQHYDLGFDPGHVLDLTFDPHEVGYEEAQAQQFFRVVLDRARATPGIQSASIADYVPMGYYNLSASIEIEGYQPPKDQQMPYAGYNVISRGYLETMGISLIRGRDIRDSDDQKSRRVALISQTMADRYWHGQDAIGRRFSFSSDRAHPLEVVGIVRDIRQEAISTQFYPFFYLSLSQHYE